MGVTEGTLEAGDEAGRGDHETELDEAVAAEVAGEAFAQRRIVVAFREEAGEAVDIGECRRKGAVVVGNHGPQKERGDAIATREVERDLGAGAAVLGKRRGDAGDVPGVER